MKDIPNIPTQGKVQQSFRRGLDSYHNSATHQAEIAARLIDLLKPLAPSHLEAALEFGCGTGHLTQPLIQNITIDQLHLNDLVPECASFAPPQAQFQAGSMQSLTLPKSLDLICSASTVQWLDDLPSALATLTQSLKPGGWLALSGFGTAQFHELISLGSTAAAPSYVDAEGWRSILPENMTVKHLSQGRRVAWFDSAKDVLKHLRDTGVNGAASQRWTAADLKAFETAYRKRFGTPQGVPLTYDPVWLIAQKAG